MADQRYRVVDRLEAGGMAEVFRGEALSVQGFKKQVAIKRVLPHLAQNPNFISMFLDEARLGARLSHANIVTVFDIGAADNTYFIVMEFIDGVNLKSMIEGLRKSGQRFPMKEAIYICIEACRGLSYAHETLGEEGEELNIVHRDVSPPNILISKRGEVKLTDFGLAKATTQLEKTDPGVVKGKFSYLSPEAAMGQEVDARADIFALGIVLWEMLAGRRLFLGETDYQTVKLVQQANIPSLTRLNPEVDEEFEGVLLKALARDPAQRYQSCRDFGDALAGYIFSHQMKVTAYDIAALVKSVSGKKPRRSQDQSIIDRLIQEELLSFTSLDDMADPLNPGAQPLSPDDVVGAQPLDIGSFENPADWFANDDEVGAALEHHGQSVGLGSEPGWRESGVIEETSDLAQLLEGGDTGELPRVPSERPSQRTFKKPSEPAAPQPPPLEPRVERAPRIDPSSKHTLPSPEEIRRSERPPKKKSGSNALIYVAILIVLLAGGAAAAWFGGYIPH
jgi:serine/threonine-protein kinase